MQAAIYIIGAGAIGKALAVFLQAAGKEVILLRGRALQEAPHTDLLKVELADGTIIEERIRIHVLQDFARLEGLIVLANKSFGNEAIARILKDKVQESPVLLLQNGLYIEKIFTDSNFPSIYRGVLLATSQLLPNELIRFKPVSPSPIGEIKSNINFLPRIIEELSNPHFAFRAEEDIDPFVWTKVILNVVFNSVCPLLETDNGIFNRDPTALGIARRVINECTAIARWNNIFLHPENIEQTLLAISRSSEGQLISTYQDIIAQRRTEIDTLNFAITKQAAALQLNEKVTETKLLGELVQLKSSLSMRPTLSP